MFFNGYNKRRSFTCQGSLFKVNSPNEQSNDLLKNDANNYLAKELPKVHRIVESPKYESVDFKVKEAVAATRPPKIFPPSHQPQYGQIGIFPTVNLNPQEKKILSNRNSAMVKRSATIRIAPPDIFKENVPRILLPENKTDTANNSSKDCILNALKDRRRKRYLDEENPATQLVNEEQVAKRRRTHETSANCQPFVVENNDIEGTSSSITLSCPRSETMSNYVPVKNSRKRVRNPIDVSYSSSKRWLDKMKVVRNGLLNSSDESNCGGSSRESSIRNTSMYEDHLPSRDTSISRSSSICFNDDDFSDDEDNKEINVITRGVDDDDKVERSSNATDISKKDLSVINEEITASNELSYSITNHNSPLFKCNLPQKSSLPKLRRTVLTTKINANHIKKPSLRSELTVKDFEKDRELERERVKQMLTSNNDSKPISNESGPSSTSKEKLDDNNISIISPVLEITTDANITSSLGKASDIPGSITKGIPKSINLLSNVPFTSITNATCAETKDVSSSFASTMSTTSSLKSFLPAVITNSTASINAFTNKNSSIASVSTSLNTAPTLRTSDTIDLSKNSSALSSKSTVTSTSSSIFSFSSSPSSAAPIQNFESKPSLFSNCKNLMTSSTNTNLLSNSINDTVKNSTLSDKKDVINSTTVPKTQVSGFSFNLNSTSENSKNSSGTVSISKANSLFGNDFKKENESNFSSSINSNPSQSLFSFSSNSQPSLNSTVKNESKNFTSSTNQGNINVFPFGQSNLVNPQFPSNDSIKNDKSNFTNSNSSFSTGSFNFGNKINPGTIGGQQPQSPPIVFGSPDNNVSNSMFSIGQNSTAPKARNIKTNRRRPIMKR